MKEFSCLLMISSLGGTERNIVLSADPFTFEPSMTEENGGVYWDCSKTFIVDIADESIFNELKVPRNYSAPPMGMSNRLTVVLQQELH